MNKKAAMIAGVAIVGLLGVFSVKNNKVETTESELDAQESIKIVHNLGETEVEVDPERVVVFDYPALDTIDALGVDRVVGVPQKNIPLSLEKYSNDEYKNVGTVKEPDLEAIKSSDPDLIIISGRQADYYDQLSEIAPTISLAKDNVNYLESTKENINTIGKIFDVEEKANEEIGELEEKISKVNKLITEKSAKALTVMVNEGNISVYGDESRFALLYQGFGFENMDDTIDDSTHGQTVTFEYLAQQNPEYLFVLDRGAATGVESTVESVLDNDIVKSMDAYKNGKIIYLDAITWYLNDGGLNSINTMIEDAMTAINK